MSDNNDKWLEAIISKTINTNKPQFDAEKWKQKFPDEFKTLLSYTDRATSHSARRINLLGSPFIKYAAIATTIIVIISLFLGRDRHVTEISRPKDRGLIQSETESISMMSLRLSYQRGGFEALDQQFNETLDVLGPRLSNLSTKELLEEINGS